jgi:hypothetical protein
MPNTLAHIGLQAPLTRLGLKTAPLQWIVLGCIIPDIPWIIQRIFRLTPVIDPVNLRMYTVCQASLFFCCILSLAFALLTKRTGFIFLLLTANILIHLLLDACQIKWGNGIHLLAPFSWHITNFGFFWPEHSISYLLTGTGLIACIVNWPKAVKSDLFLQKPNKIKATGLAFTLLFYILAPVFFIDAAYNADVHYSRTIVDKARQTGKTVEIDRGRYGQHTKTIATYADSALSINNPPAISGKLLSVKGVFDQKNSITITEYHEHKSHRDYASYAGLGYILLLWLYSIIRMQKHRLHVSNMLKK